MTFGQGIHPSIDRSSDVERPSLASYTHRISLVYRIGSRANPAPLYCQQKGNTTLSRPFWEQDKLNGACPLNNGRAKWQPRHLEV